jgi:Phosphoserine phosphatase
VARYLGIDHVVCNRFVVDEHGVLTGEVQRPVIWGTSKATSVQKFAAEHGVDLRSSYFYADGDEDLSLMYLVGNPRPVNPGPRLTKVAERRGWPILRFSSRGGGGPLGRVRNLAAIGSLGPPGGRRAEPGRADQEQARRGQLPDQVLAGACLS